MTFTRVLSVAACLALVVSFGDAQGLGKKKGGGGTTSGGSSSGGSSNSGGSKGGGNSGGLGNQGRQEQSNKGGGGSGGLGNLGRQEQGGNSSRGSGQLGDLGQVNKPNRDQRPLPPVRGGGNQDILGKPKGDNGRSGSSNYGGGNNNQFGRGQGRPVDVGSAPIDLRGGSLANQVIREDSPYARSWRSGYYSYNSNWCDDWFWYPHYSFSYRQGCSVSPWYFYVNLPGFIISNRVTYVDGYSCQWGYGDPYRWNRNGWDNWDNSWNRRDRDLDYALDDLMRAWERADRRSLDRLIPTRGRVGIYMEDRYCYSLDSRDFYDLMLDNINGTRTNRYEITSVRSSRNDAQIAARHEFVDPWGRRSTIYHHYRLQRDRNDYVITDFLISSRRTGW
ncbi:MAG TPA: hypothetical protein PKA27_01065 [Fimbriimonadaceae bacterium]|mgnify:CR=1 FL=1|nr:hypothetical protein [Fimbriimonadaceae bacterium]